MKLLGEYRRERDEAILVLRAEKSARVSERASWERERDDYERRLNRLVRDANMTKFWGNNQVKRRDFDQFMYANMNIIANFLKNEYLPHVKLPPRRFARYDPEEPRSVYSRVSGDLALPEGSIDRIYWQLDVEPLFGKTFSDLRANMHARHKEVYLGE